MILIVEDNPEVAGLLSEIVTATGYEAFAVATGQAALDALVSADFKLALIDLTLPDIPGEDVARAIRAAGNHIPMIAISGRLRQTDDAALGAVGFVKALAKPFKFSELTELIHKLAGRRADDADT